MGQGVLIVHTRHTNMWTTRRGVSFVVRPTMAAAVRTARLRTIVMVMAQASVCGAGQPLQGAGVHTVPLGLMRSEIHNRVRSMFKVNARFVAPLVKMKTRTLSLRYIAL